MSPKNIYVTQPFLPPLEELTPYLEKIWATKILTNGGPYHQELESTLCEHLGVKHISLFNNGIVALITALQALEISGEVITTPYSFVATANSLLWNNIKPVFVDIDPNSLNIDPKNIEAAITEKTSAILPVHCYGNSCDVDAIKQIAEKYNLKIIYDAAHAFGVNNDQGSILNHGDLSILSFHATKVFNTFEGGAIICQDAHMKKRIDNLKNFGFINETTVIESGINGKMSELNAAVGLLQLKYMQKIIAARREIATRYNEALKDTPGITNAEINLKKNSNYSYYPILIRDDFPISRDDLYELMKQDGIYTRRYFYPLISDFPMYQNLNSAKPSNLSVATKVASQVLCLPIYPGLEIDTQSRIINLIKSI